MFTNENEPVYTIGIAAKLLKVCSATLRIWEKKGLIFPIRLGKNRYYSKCDMEQLIRIKEMIRKNRINIEGVKKILSLTRCWDIKNCDISIREKCPIYLNFARA